MTKYKILVVDDEESLCEILQFNLEVEGYEVDVAYSAEQALDMHPERYSLILLDVMMGETSGFKMARQLKSRPETAGVPIIFCTARDTEDDTVAGLNIGADDYIAKPFHPQELVARVRSQLRRYTQLGDVNAQSQGGEIVNGRLCYRPEERVLLVDGEPVKLTATELKIVDLLMRNLGRVFPAEEIYRRVWNEEAYATENTVMVHIRRIREKIELNPKEPEYLKVVWGIGYKIEKR